MYDLKELTLDMREIKNELKSMNDTLLRNTVSLEIHEKRTTLAEKRIDKLEDQSKWVIGLIFTSTVGILVKLFLK